MDLKNISEHLSSVLNACGIVLPSVNLRQKTMKHSYTIWNIVQSIERNNPEEMIVGSTAEGLDLLSSDIDLTSVLPVKVFERKSEVNNFQPAVPSFHVLRIPDPDHPGYSTLSVAKCGEDVCDYLVLHNRNHCLKNDINIRRLLNFAREYPEELSIHGPAINTSWYSTKETFALFREAGNATEIDIANCASDIKTDFVVCLRGDQWPVEASEWKTRRMSVNWPPMHLFDDIINSGYYLAGVGSKESQHNDIQWRVSFNKAEQLIAESFNETQVHCNIILKLFRVRLLSDITGKNITSYSIKTVMFWCLDEKPEEYWQSSNLVSCICFCISKLKSFVETRILPNYFIRKRNMFISSEFTRDIQMKTLQCLDKFLQNPTASMSLILPTYKMYQNTPCLKLNRISQEKFIENWLRLRVCIAQNFHSVGGREFWKLYDGYNIKEILLRCHDLLEKFTTLSYAQPFVKILQSCMGVLHYILLMKEKQTSANRKDSDNRRKYAKYMELSFAGEVTNTNLRIATCYLDDGVMKDCLKLIRTVTGKNKLFMVNYEQEVIETLDGTIEAFQNMEPICKDKEIEMYNRVIRKDLTEQDPYRTIEEFEIMEKEGNNVGGYNVFNLIWKQTRFFVIFMPAELPVLPKPAALELCNDNSQTIIFFHPLHYGLLLEFLWHVRNGSMNRDKDTLIEIMKKTIQVMQNEKHHGTCIGLNFLTYCCCLQKDYSTASRYLIESFKLNPVKENVSYLYIKYIINLLLEI